METLEDVLEHFGVKGMKWGVRKNRDASGKKLSKLSDERGDRLTKDDAKWVKKAAKGSLNKQVEVYNKAAEAMNNHHIERINNKPEYKNADLSKPGKLQTKYYKEYEDTLNAELQKATDGVFGNSPSGKYKVRMDMDPGSILPGFSVDFTDAKHDNAAPKIVLTRNKMGHITHVEIKFDEIAQGAFFTEEYLAHFGVKGMKWGVRRKSGPKGPASDDFSNAAAAKAKIKSAGGTHALSNKELQDIVTRMNLETQYARLNPKTNPIMKGQKIAKEIIDVAGTANTVIALSKSPAMGLIKDSLAKK